MTLFLVSLVAIMLMILLMSVGVLAGREPLKGTCGGLNRFTGDKECPVCGGDNTKCATTKATANQLGHDVMKED